MLMGVMVLSGCTQSYEKEIRASVDGFFSAILEGDEEKALESTVGKDKFIDGSFLTYMKEILIETISFDELMEENDILISESMMAKVDELYEYIVDKMVDDYKITEVIEEKDEATVKVTVNMLENADYESLDFESIVTTYQDENFNALVDIYLSQGEAAMQQKMIDDLFPVFLEEMKKIYDEATYEEVEMVVTVHNIDGNWKLYKIK